MSRLQERLAIRRRTLIAGGASALALPAVHARAQTAGVALVIGNSKYHWESSLPNVKRDVADVARSFQALGLKTELLQDLGQAAMVQAIDRFKASANGASLAVLYFAGHGVILGETRANFLSNLVPVDADLSRPAPAKTLVSVPSAVAALEGAANHLVVLDSCRNNPADGWRNRTLSHIGGSGFSDHAVVNYNLPPNTLVLTSTAPGYAALDGPAGQNSPFAAAFLRQIAVPPVDLWTLPGRLRRDLLLATQGRQVVFSQGNYGRSFVLAGAGAPTAPASYNPASVVELPNAYALARQAGLPIPAGLVGYRTPGSPDAQKVGAYQYEHSGPAIFVVLSVEGGQAEALTVTKGEGRAAWRYVHANVSGNDLSFLSFNEQSKYSFQWTNANAGSMSLLSMQGGGSKGSSGLSSARFTRID